MAERHTIQCGRVWLTTRPITAVSAVRLGELFCTPRTLTVTTDYLVDGPRGRLTFGRYLSGEVEVDYTVPQTVPADIAEAAGLIVTGWLREAAPLSGAAGIFKSMAMDGQTLVYRDPAIESLEVHPAAELLLRRYCRLVLA